MSEKIKPGHPSEGRAANDYPEWITGEMVELTKQVWEGCTSASISAAEAVELIFAMQQLLDAAGLTRLVEVNEEEILGMGTGEQPGAGT